MHEPNPGQNINIQWAERPHRTAIFQDCQRRECNLGDSSAYGERAIRFGVVEAEQSAMHLRIQDLVPILEHLRAFVRDGSPSLGVSFQDWNGRQCILRPSARGTNTVELGVLKVPSSNWQDDSLHPVRDSVMSLSRTHLEALLPNINSFIAHGSVRPDLVYEWFG